MPRSRIRRTRDRGRQRAETVPHPKRKSRISVCHVGGRGLSYTRRPLFCSSAAVSLLHLRWRLITSTRYAERHIQPVPAVDRYYCQREPRQFRLLKLLARALIDLIRNTFLGQQRHPLRPLQGRPLAFAVSAPFA